MSTTVLTTPTDRIPKDPTRRTAFVGGAFYVITFASSIPALLLLAPVLNSPDYIVGSGADTQVLWGCLLDLVTALAGVGSSVALFSVVKRQHEGLALGFVTTRIMEAAMILIGVISLLAVVTLRQAGTAGADPATLVTVGQALVATRDWTFLLGPTLMAGFNALMLAPLMYRSHLVPRVIPLLGLVGAPLLLTSTTATMFGLNHLGSLWSAVAVAPIFVWELSLGVYLAVKGFKPSPITASLTVAGTPPAYRDTAV
jgi:hypothetical protein